MAAETTNAFFCVEMDIRLEIFSSAHNLVAQLVGLISHPEDIWVWREGWGWKLR